METPPSDWYVSLPLQELVTLLTFSQELNRMDEENKQLRREMEGLRNLFSEVSQQLGDIKRHLRKT